MKFFLVISTLVAVALAKPGVFHGAAVVAPVAYTRLVPGAPIGLDGRVVDTPEVAHAKAEHAAAHINERVSLANEAVKSADVVTTYAAPAVVAGYSAPAVVSAYSAPAVVAPAVVPAAVTIARGATVGLDGRVVDTPEVAAAKVAHAAAHISAKVTLANEAARNYAAFAPAPAVVSAYSAPVVSAVYPAAHSLVY